MRQGLDLRMPECDHAVPCRSRLTPLVGVLRMFERLSRMFLPRQVILFSVLLFGGTVGMRRGIVQFSRALVVLVMRSIVVASGHIQAVSIRPDLLWASFAILYA